MIYLGLLCLLFPAKASAQSSNRWLFVFNTSASMRDRVQGIQAITQDLLTTAMHGNIRPGDTIGIWTYSADLRAEEAPLQIWYPDTARSIAQNTVQFIGNRSYEKTAAFGDVLTNMLRVIKMSDVITVILVSDGADPVKGTPFDARLEGFYKENYQPQKKARMPIVTVFRGERGIITTNTLGLAPWPVEIPAVPPPVVAKATVEKPVPVAPPKPVPSLVMVGKKAETTFNPPTDLPEHVDQPTLAPAAESKPAEVKTQPLPVAEPAPLPKVEEPPKPVVAPVAVAPTPAPPVVVEPPKPAEPAVTSAAQEPVAKVAAPEPPAPVQTAAAVPERELFSSRNIAIVSVVFTLLVCTLLFLTARNARRAARTSLITRSLDREGK